MNWVGFQKWARKGPVKKVPNKFIATLNPGPLSSSSSSLLVFRTINVKGSCSFICPSSSFLLTLSFVRDSVGGGAAANKSIGQEEEEEEEEAYAEYVVVRSGDSGGTTAELGGPHLDDES